MLKPSRSTFHSAEHVLRQHFVKTSPCNSISRASIRALSTQLPSSPSSNLSVNADQRDLASLERQLASLTLHGRAALPPYYHPPTHHIPVALLHLRSHHPSLLTLFAHFAAHAASALAIPVSRPAPLPTRRTLWTVPKGPFVHKKSQENFERKVYARVLKAWDADAAVVQRWLDYLSTYPCPGVGMRIVRWVRAPVGIGRDVAELDVSAKVRGGEDTPAGRTDREKMEGVAKRIVEAELAAAGLGAGGFAGSETPSATIITSLKA